MERANLQLCGQVLTAVGGMESILNEFYRQSKHPPGGDEVIGALSTALFRETALNDTVAEALEDVITLRRLTNDDLSPSEVAGIIRCTLLNDQLQQGNEPQYWSNPNNWRAAIREVAQLVTQSEPAVSESERAERLWMNLVGDHVNTNPFTRAAPDELLMQVLTDRFPDGYTWLDIGSGMVEVPNQILAKDRYPFEPIKMYRRLGRTAISAWKEAPDLTQKANQLLNRPHRLKRVVAVDLINPYKSMHNQNLARAALRPDELKNSHYMEKWDGLAKEHPDELEFVEADFTNERDVRLFTKSINSLKFDLITISTVQHQLSRKERMRMDMLALQQLADGGLLMKKDFIESRPSDPRANRFFKHWHLPGRYRAVVCDPANPSQGWQEIVRAMDSRCTDLAIGWGVLAVNGSFQSFDRLIMAA